VKLGGFWACNVRIPILGCYIQYFKRQEKNKDIEHLPMEYIEEIAIFYILYNF